VQFVYLISYKSIKLRGNKMKLNKIILSFVSALVILFSTSVASFAKVVGDKIILGAAISLTGKYSSNGVILKMVITWPLTELTAWVV